MSAWALVSAAGTGAAVLALRPPPSFVVRVRCGPVPGRPSAVVPARAVRRLAVSGAAVVAMVLVRDPASVLVAGTVAGLVAFGLGRWRADRHRRRVVAARADVAGSLDLLAAEIRAGILPSEALRGAADEVAVLAPAADAVRLGADPVAALRLAAERPGAHALADLAAAWSVAERCGAPLAAVLERLGVSVRDELELAREVQAEAAPARATGRLMAVLPLLGLALGSGLGSDPLHVLLRTVPGALCLAVGTLLACVGVAWIDRLVDSAEVG